MPPSSQARRRALSAGVTKDSLRAFVRGTEVTSLAFCRAAPSNFQSLPSIRRKRRASLETFTKRAQRAAQSIGRAVRAIEEKADGARIAHFGTPGEPGEPDEIAIITVPDRSEWH